MNTVTTAQTEPPGLDRILRRDELAAYVGVARSAIEEMINNGEFPRPIRINDAGRILGWLESEVIAWQQRRKILRDTGKAPLPRYRPIPPRPELRRPAAKKVVKKAPARR